ncbi:hypothetical protein BVG16_12275 [Paenibacillus selenitireducens]|uniref:DUF421 domain-containing protein n=1 Tax=Paenibacillus selenitireducens TaxID=1324314 RepID=A0A1T2XFN5_9BACL|nr:DUF421 domain-containing protein [Paenibacillus selenitireducens]OPA78632.1 hypothetical protein BVG16_12275 [Paenibacillus selenitireducens]
MGQFFEILIRSVAGFGIMMVIARILGKATISQMTYHDFVAAITLGALTANFAFNVTMSTWQILVALLTFGGIAYLLMVLAMKSRMLRKWISGQPTVIMQNGKILESNMRKLKMTLDMLNQELREKNIFNIEEVEYAVLELNGKITVLRKEEYLPVLRKDLNLQAGMRQSFPVELIMDGEIIDDNLKQNGIEKEWLLSQVKMRGFSINNIDYAVKSANGHLYFDLYKDQIRHTVDKE